MKQGQIQSLKRIKSSNTIILLTKQNKTKTNNTTKKNNKIMRFKNISFTFLFQSKLKMHFKNIFVLCFDFCGIKICLVSFLTVQDST